MIIYYNAFFDRTRTNKSRGNYVTIITINFPALLRIFCPLSIFSVLIVRSGESQTVPKVTKKLVLEFS